MHKWLDSRSAVVVLLLAALFVPLPTYASRYRKYKPLPPMAKVDVTVLRAADGKPLQHVAVVFHVKGTKDEGNMELKTNEDGKASLDIIPIGSEVLVQVIAPGFRTFGEKYDVPTSKKSITIKMLPPGQQYSIYIKSHPKPDRENNTPHAEMGHAAPTDSPLLTPPTKKEE